MFRAALWFGLGIYTCFAASICLSADELRAHGWWNSEVGVYVGVILLVPMTCILTAIFMAWLAIRRVRDLPKRYGFVGFLGLGLSYPILVFGHVTACWAIVPNAMGLATIAGLFGIPVFLVEVTIYLARIKMQANRDKPGE